MPVTLETKIPANAEYSTQELTSRGKCRCLVPAEGVIHRLGYEAKSFGASRRLGALRLREERGSRTVWEGNSEHGGWVHRLRELPTGLLVPLFGRRPTAQPLYK